MQGRGRRLLNDGLSRREYMVLTQLQRGKSSKEISLELKISPRTVQKHLERVYRHLKVQTRAEAIVFMQQRAKQRGG